MKTARMGGDVSAIGISDLLPGVYMLRSCYGNTCSTHTFTKY